MGAVPFPRRRPPSDDPLAGLRVRVPDNELRGWTLVAPGGTRYRPVKVGKSWVWQPVR